MSGNGPVYQQTHTSSRIPRALQPELWELDLPTSEPARAPVTPGPRLHPQQFNTSSGTPGPCSQRPQDLAPPASVQTPGPGPSFTRWWEALAQLPWALTLPTSRWTPAPGQPQLHSCLVRTQPTHQPQFQDPHLRPPAPSPAHQQISSGTPWGPQPAVPEPIRTPSRPIPPPEDLSLLSELCRTRPAHHGPRTSHVGTDPTYQRANTRSRNPGPTTYCPRTRLCQWASTNPKTRQALPTRGQQPPLPAGPGNLTGPRTCHVHHAAHCNRRTYAASTGHPKSMWPGDQRAAQCWDTEDVSHKRLLSKPGKQNQLTRDTEIKTANSAK